MIDQEENDHWYADFENTTKEVDQGERRKDDTRGLIHLSDLAGEDHFRNLPDGRRGLGNFELFMRLCEAWTMNAKGECLHCSKPSAEQILL